MYELRPYQSLAIENLRNEIRSGNKRPLLISSTGSGKTVIASHLIQSAVIKRSRVLFIAHRKEIIDQTSEKLRSMGIEHAIIMSGHPPSAMAEVFVASIQTLIRRELPKADLIIFDECFPAGTIVDGKNIEDLVVGDMVSSVNHENGDIELKRITRLFKHETSKNMIMLTYGESKLLCTSNHPFFVKGKGYVKADRIDTGDMLCMSENFLQETSDRKETTKGMLDRVQKEALIGNYEAYESAICQCKDGEKEPNAQQENTGKDGRYIKENWPQTDNQEREWNRTDSSGVSDFERTRVGNKRNSEYRDEARERIPLPLQTGCGGQEAESVYRSGRVESLSFIEEGAGCEERHFLTWVRVDRIESIEQASTRGTTVYNIEVEENNNYFANGILVHNCHHIVANTYKKIIDAYPEAVIIGLTATPCRGDGRGLGDVFNSIVQVAQTHELISQGYLVPTICYAPSKPDLGGVNIKRGDYDAAALEKAVDKPKLVGDIVDHWHALAADRQTIVFATGISHSMHLVEAFRNSGVTCEHIDGETPKKHREEILSRLASGEVRVVCNVGVLTEGFDAPSVSCIVLARPTKSFGLYLQMAGRGLRPYSGKDNLLLLDHAGAVYEHGLIDQHIDWVLGDKEKAFKKTEYEKRTLMPWTCGHCFKINEPSKDKHCSGCGLKPDKMNKSPAIGEGSLKRIEKAVRRFTSMPDKQKFWLECAYKAKHLGLKIGAAAHMYKKVTGVWPRGLERVPRGDQWKMSAEAFMSTNDR